MKKIFLIRKDFTPGERQELDKFCDSVLEGVELAAYLGKGTFVALEGDCGSSTDSLRRETELRMQAAREYILMSWLSRKGNRYLLRTKEGVMVVRDDARDSDDPNRVRQELEATAKEACSGEVVALITEQDDD